MDDDKTQSEADARKDLMGLLRSKDLSPEEHKKILAIATSIGNMPKSSGADHAGSHVSKAVFILVTLIGIALMTLAWFLLGRMRENMQRTGPRAGGAPAVERDGEVGIGKGPGK